ncbi:MAG: toll/interleukin-1 receptor domain-containing protein [Candidatus Desulfofervidaceae bacterium]|nr:toll/interleukin-1 receptor domain-containing protein [Candidatus Desulfofervidaceae bacterium]
MNCELENNKVLTIGCRGRLFRLRLTGAPDLCRYIKMEKPRIFISYCHKDIKKVRKIDADLSILEEIEIIRDERKLSFTDNIISYMKLIRKCDYVLVLVSDSFLKSTACMFEIFEFFKDEDYKKRILPVIIENARIYDHQDIIEYIKYWENKERELRQFVNKIQDHTKTIKPLMELSIIQRWIAPQFLDM